jgi:U5 small nuclear ribonucleoprotein component
MDDSLYDEFGNYLGPDLEEEEDEDLDMEEEQEEEEDQPIDDEVAAETDETSLMQIDGKHYIQVIYFSTY